MDDVIEMTPPSVLDGDRPVTNYRDSMGTEAENETERLRMALRESCEYGMTLWRELDGMRQYLLESAPQRRNLVGEPRRLGATPLGPDDDEGWARWKSAFQSAMYALCGPSGDSGLAAQEAALEVRDRRLDDVPDPIIVPPPVHGTVPPVPNPADYVVVPIDEAARNDGEKDDGEMDDGSDAPHPDKHATSRPSYRQFVAGTVFGLALRALLHRQGRHDRHRQQS